MMVTLLVFAARCRDSTGAGQRLVACTDGPENGPGRLTAPSTKTCQPLNIDDIPACG
jgi:hypothetical protein